MRAGFDAVNGKKRVSSTRSNDHEPCGRGAHRPRLVHDINQRSVVRADSSSSLTIFCLFILFSLSPVDANLHHSFAKPSLFLHLCSAAK